MAVKCRDFVILEAYKELILSFLFSPVQYTLPLSFNYYLYLTMKYNAIILSLLSSTTLVAALDFIEAALCTSHEHPEKCIVHMESELRTMYCCDQQLEKQLEHSGELGDITMTIGK